MGETLRQWILTLTGTAAFSALSLSLLPESGGKRIVRFVCGLGILAAMLSLGTEFRWESYAVSLARYRRQGENIARAGEQNAAEQTRAFIESECGAYIASKARELGGGLEAAVTAEWSGEGYWYPFRAVITGSASPEVCRQVAEYMETELGIPGSRQTWETTDEAE